MTRPAIRTVLIFEDAWMIGLVQMTMSALLPT